VSSRRASSPLASIFVAVWAVCALCSCAAGRELIVVSTDLTVRRLAPGIWLHTTTQEGAVPVPANGLLVELDESVLMVDSGWSSAAAERVMAFAQSQLGKPVQHVVVTHSHVDRSGGLEAVATRLLTVTMLDGTAARLPRASGQERWKTFGNRTTVGSGKNRVELFFPGGAHSPDNIVAWVPREKVLFAGCLLKDEDAEDLGNLADAQLGTWSAALKRIRSRYPSAKIVVPGHGDPGGRELFRHTDSLVESALKRPPQ
jgi:metallo-beta-lactamase class B